MSIPPRSRRSAPRTALAIALAALCAAGAGAQMTLRVDAAEIHRSLVHARITLPARPGAMSLRYVEWLPGNHNPSGPIWNVVDFFVRDGAGAPLEWRRDPLDPYRITCAVPEGVDTITLEHTYIANQPWANGRSTDTYGRPGFGALNWNSVAFYPEGADKDELTVDAALVLPEGWTVATDLPIAGDDAGVFDFEPVSLARLVDSPVIFGAPGQIRTYELPVEGGGRFHLHGAAAEAGQLELPEERRESLARVIEQTHRVFGPYPHDDYHFLVLLGDFGRFGVEHNTSTYINMASGEWMNAGKPGAGTMSVVPHEYSHVWSGKLRSPAGLHGRDYHTDADTSLLWVYEGLASYYDDVVSVRAGLTDAQRYRDDLLGALTRYEQQSGRAWRSVEDTARAMRFLRASYDRFSDRIRRQDYYGEGALFWMLADATIRRGTNFERSLDDWTLAFHSVPFDDWGAPVTYTRADIVASLEEVYAGADWDALIRRYIETPGSTITADLPALLGWRIVTTAEPPEERSADEGRTPHAALIAGALGLTISREGRITGVRAGSPADRAGLAHGSALVAVDDLLYTPEALRDAIGASTERGVVTLVVESHGRIATIDLDYGAGLQYRRLERIEEEPDLIEMILTPR